VNNYTAESVGFSARGEQFFRPFDDEVADDVEVLVGLADIGGRNAATHG